MDCSIQNYVFSRILSQLVESRCVTKLKIDSIRGSKIAVNTELRRDRCLNICSPITLKLLLIEVFVVFERTIEQMFSRESLTAFVQVWSISVFSVRFKPEYIKKKVKYV